MLANVGFEMACVVAARRAIEDVAGRATARAIEVRSMVSNQCGRGNESSKDKIDRRNDAEFNG